MGWLVYFVDEIILGLSSLNQCTSTVDNVACGKALAPNFLLFFENQYLNIFFWILVIFIILSIIKHFKYRKTDPNLGSATNQRPYPR